MVNYNTQICQPGVASFDDASVSATEKSERVKDHGPLNSDAKPHIGSLHQWSRFCICSGRSSPVSLPPHEWHGNKELLDSLDYKRSRPRRCQDCVSVMSS
ncbi:unnamed protein product [Pieris brassicae]|uniref:Uncharacterized protein n=1 Tax=Pieris brassicae TaxID=7116 RepID=A0A9P0U2J8_PIEBR|nr:unnamed protein product [Pieris brassicae]